MRGCSLFQPIRVISDLLSISCDPKEGTEEKL